MASPASPQQPSLRQDLVRITVLIYPKEGLTFEEFTNYWLNTHGPLISSLDIVKKNLTKYEQFHFNPELNKGFVERGLAATSFWGMAVLEAESYEKIFALWEDEEYLQRARPDEAKFLDRSKTSLVAGRFVDFVGK